MTNSYGLPDVYASHCYIVVSQDVRGQYKSDGAFVSVPRRGGRRIRRDRVGSEAAEIERQGRHVRAVVSGRDAMAAGDAAAAAPHDHHSRHDVVRLSRRLERTRAARCCRPSCEDWPTESIAASAMRHYPDGAALGAEFAAAARPTPTSGACSCRSASCPSCTPRSRESRSYFYDWVGHPDNDAYWQQWSIRERWSSINGSGAELRRLVRHLPQRCDRELRRHAQTGRVGGRARRAAARDRAVGPYQLAASRGSDRLRAGGRQPDAGADAALVRLLAQGNSERRGQGSARQGLRDGREHVAQRERVAD